MAVQKKACGSHALPDTHLRPISAERAVKRQAGFLKRAAVEGGIEQESTELPILLSGRLTWIRCHTEHVGLDRNQFAAVIRVRRSESQGKFEIGRILGAQVSPKVFAGNLCTRLGEQHRKGYDKQNC